MTVRHDVAGEALRLRFDRFDLEAYRLFLRTKQLPEHAMAYDEAADTYTIETPVRFARILGFEPEHERQGWLPMPAHLFDYQRHFIETALAAQRYAVWADTGLGKTLIELEWARQVQQRTGGRVLMVYFLNLIPQVLDMALQFYGEDLQLRILGTRVEMREWCKTGAPGIAIVNPEKFIPRGGEPEIVPEITFCSGVAVDESSILKTGGGAIKWALIKSCRGVEYKLSCTATPAPNDPIEYASQASWLEKIRDEGEVIWTFFNRDSDGEWKVKDHALPSFYRFLSGWSCYLRSPARYGFADNLRDLPAPERLVHEIEATKDQLEAIYRIADTTGQTSLVEPDRLDIAERMRLGTLAFGFLYGANGEATRVQSRKPRFIADLVRAEVAAGLQVLVWTQYDETVEILREELAGSSFEVLTGSVPVDDRPDIVERFRSGQVSILVTRPKLLGFGANLQNCGSMVFADITDSYEQIYQAERRAYRYGQKRSVRIHFPIVPELQGTVWANLQGKQAAFERDVTRMERLYIDAMRELLPARSAA